MAQELITVDFARRQIATAKSIGEVKGIYDKLEALKRYAKSSRLDLDEQNAIAEASVWAAWKGGHLLKETERHPGTRGQLQGRSSSGGSIMKPPESTVAKLGGPLPNKGMALASTLGPFLIHDCPTLGLEGDRDEVLVVHALNL